ncbi:MAG: putative signaling protein, partial [bacterium]
MAKILIVDDSLTSRQLLITPLSKSNYELFEANNGKEALEIALTQYPDLVITDIMMPTMDGYELAKRLRSNRLFDNTNIIFYTIAALQQEAEALGEACQIFKVLIKPVSPKALIRIVEEALEGYVMKTLSGQRVKDHLLVLGDRLAEKTSELDTVTKRLAEILSITYSLATERNPQQILEKFCQTGHQVIGSEFAILKLSDENTKNFYTSGLGDSNSKLIRNKLDLGICNILFKNRIAYRQHNPNGTPESWNFPIGFPSIFSLLSVKISSPTTSYGYLSFANKISTNSFSDSDEQIAITLAAQLAIAYENALRYEQLEQKNTELSNSNNRLQTIVDNSPLGIYICKACEPYETTFVSPNTLEMLGYEPKEFLEDPEFWKKKVHPEDLPNILVGF